jgi:class 3 adenylate cyclase
MAVFGGPPFPPHASDPARGVLAALDAMAALAAAGVGAGIGLTTGPVYSGVIGGERRREMCVLGAVVNMAARLMAQAGCGGILVDRATRDGAALTVGFRGLSLPFRPFDVYS